MTDSIRQLVLAHASQFSLDPATLLAQVQVESGGDPTAWNPEPRYRYFWDMIAKKPFRTVTDAEIGSKFPPKDFHAVAGDADQEWWAQQASFGLLQVMGAVARELGCTSSYLTALVDPAVGLHFGCLKLKAELVWARGDMRSALAAYNGGRMGNAPGGSLRNGFYADKVLAVRATVHV